jgi:hypothetical protein
MANELAVYRARLSKALADYTTAHDNAKKTSAARRMAEILSDAPKSGFTEIEVTRGKDVPSEVRRLVIEQAVLIANNLIGWCRLSYDAKAGILARAKSAGITEIEVIEPADFPVMCVIGVQRDELVIAFRGTVNAVYGDEWKTWAQMLSGWFVNVAGAFVPVGPHTEEITRSYGGKGHVGFPTLLDEIWEPLTHAYPVDTQAYNW